MIRQVVMALILLLAVCPRAGFSLDFSEIETEHFTIRFGEALSAIRARGVADEFEVAFFEMERSVGPVPRRPIDVVIFGRTGDFTVETGLPYWSASAMIDGAIYMQPVAVLEARRVLDTTIRHEVCLVFLYRRFGAHLPLWFAEGLAVHHAGEIEIIKRGVKGDRPRVDGPNDIDRLLRDGNDRERNRWGYVLAYEAALSIIKGAVVVQSRKGDAP